MLFTRSQRSFRNGTSSGACRGKLEGIHSLTLQVPFPEIAVNVVRQARFTEEQDDSKQKGKAQNCLEPALRWSSRESEMQPRDRL